MEPLAKILVVDDEEGVRFALEKTLTRDGHQVVAVESGEAALEQIATQKFDLALIDLNLIGIDGMAVLTALRQRSPDTTAIMLTAYASLETAVAALRQGAHDYLFKPCKTVELRESVRTGLLKRQREMRQRELLTQLEHLLGQYRPDQPPAAAPDPAAPAPVAAEPAAGEQARFRQQGNLIVDLMRHVITLDGQLLELSTTEFDLLAYLVSESPRVVSASELVREVRGYESEAWEARDIVRQHVHRIRHKAQGLTGRADVIRTVRGVGYTIGQP